MDSDINYNLLWDASYAANTGDLQKVRELLKAAKAPEPIIQLVLGCLDRDPTTRYSYNEVMQCLQAALPQPTPTSTTNTAPTMVPLDSSTASSATTAAPSAASKHFQALFNTAEPPLQVEVQVTLGTTISQKAPKGGHSPSATSKTWVRFKNICKDLAAAVRPQIKVGESGASDGSNNKFFAKAAASNLSKLGKARLLPITRSSTGVIA